MYVFIILLNLQGKGIGDVSVSAGEDMTSTTTAEGVYVLNNVTAGGYTIQVCDQRLKSENKKRSKDFVVLCSQATKTHTHKWHHSSSFHPGPSCSVQCQANL